MRWGLLSVRVGILVVSVITTMLLLLAVVPLASGVGHKVPPGENAGWNYDNSTTPFPSEPRWKYTTADSTTSRRSRSGSR